MRKSLVRGCMFWIAICVEVMCIQIIIISNTYANTPSKDTFKPYIATNLLYDSNLLRLSKDVDPVGKSSKGDFIKTINAGIEMDWKLSRQQFIVKADVNQNWFQNFDVLDYFGWDVQAQWNWQIGADWKGEFGYSNTQKLASFDEINVLIPNLDNYSVYKTKIAYLFHPRGRIGIELFRTENENDDNSRQSSDLTENNAELNLEYLSPSGSNIGIRILATDGEYPNRQFTQASQLDNGFLRMDYAVTFGWTWSEKTEIYGRVGYTEQEYEHLTSNDFGDITAQLNLHWYITEQTFIVFSAWREIRQVDDISSSFNLSQGMKIIPTWQMTPKVKMNASIGYEQKDYQRISNLNTGTRKDTIWQFIYDVAYKPFDFITFDLKLGLEKKDSNKAFNAYETLSTGLNVRVDF